MSLACKGGQQWATADTQTGTVDGQSGVKNDESGTENDQTEDSGSSKSPYASIERPSQSDTVEVIPGKPSDVKKDEADTSEEGKTDENSAETDTESGTDTGSGETSGDTGTGTGTDATGNTGTQGEGENEGTENTGSSTDDTDAGNTDSTGSSTEQTGETGESGTESVTQPEGDKSSTEKNYDYFYDKDEKKFYVTFNIKEEAKGDQTVELSKVLEEITASGKEKFEQWLKTEDGQKELKWYSSIGYTQLNHNFDGVPYTYNMNNGSVDFSYEPACTFVFDVNISNGSKHTYVYKDGSFKLSTPDVSNGDNTGITGFDGQELPEQNAKGFVTIKYDIDHSGENGVIEDIIDEALKDSKSRRRYYIDATGNLTTTYTKPIIQKGTEVYKFGNKYYAYSEQSNCYYASFTETQVEYDSSSGKYVVKKNWSNKTSDAYKLEGDTLVKYYAPYVRGSSIVDMCPTKDAIITALNNYLYKNNTTLKEEILKCYNTKLDTSYSSFEELCANNQEALNELTRSTETDNSSLASLNPVLIRSNELYNEFYNSILSFNVGNKDDIEKFLSRYQEASGGHSHYHGSWATEGENLTFGDYMADQLNKTDGAWEKANQYFNALTASGITKDEATWAAFTMAINTDGERADNAYQNSAWSWYSSIVLKQQDGTLNLTKVDTESNQLGDDEGEGQTSFYLWTVDKKTETADDGSEKTTEVTKYCVYVDPVYETVKNDDGSESQKLVKDGYYGWVEYDPDNKALNYTISTTNGTLNIDYTLLEGVVYYLQEKAAPDGYDVDSNIYVICDETAYKKMTEENGTTSVVNQATGVESTTVHMGAIKGGETLKVNFINGKTVVVPDPEPEPDSKPDTTPDNNNDSGNSGNNGGNGGSKGNGGSNSSTNKSTTEEDSSQVLGAERDPEKSGENNTEESIKESGRVLGSERLPKTGDNGADAPVMMFGFGLIAALYAWISKKRAKDELK